MQRLFVELQTIRTQWGEEKGKKNTIPIMNHLKGNKICQTLGFI